MNNYDYIIVGGGASGLMMAYRMANDSFFDNKKIVIIDKEYKNTNDRTWCYWQDKNDEWQDIVCASWKQIIFKSKWFSTKETILPYQYKMIRSKDFYHKIITLLETKINFTIKKENIKGIQQQKLDAIVITEKATYTTKTVLNSVFFDNSYTKQTKYPVLQQHFVGFFIKTKQSFFDVDVATFMDFHISQKGNTRFMYVLPYAKNEALFEYTLFSKDLLPFEEYKCEIEKYLAEKNITDYVITEKEQGAIPMTCYKFWEKNTSNILHIGTAGGWTKASTGFTFKNTCKKSNALVDFLKQGKPLHKFYKTNKFWFYDLLLLDVLANKNEVGASVFSKMFQRNTTKKILKFLDEETSFLEDLQLLIKIPPVNFIHALFHRIIG